jgi:type I restriction enzyme S subunit
MMTNTTYKQTEIGRIPEDWEVYKFSTVSFMKGRIGWQGLKQTEFTQNEDEPFLITGMNFKDGMIRWEEVYHVSGDRYEIAKEIQLKHGDVLMTKDGTIGKLLYVESIPYPYKATLNSHLLVFRPLNNKYNSKYLYYHLASPNFLKHIELTKSGTTFFGVSQTSVGEYQIILPPLPEQTAIAAALSDADAYIESLELLLEKKRQLKQGAMQELLRPGEGWEVKKLGEVCEVIGGGTPSTFSSTFWNGNIKWFTPTEVGMTKYLFESRRTITQLGLNNSSANILPVNSILLTSRAGIGDLGILKTVACTNQGFQSLICKSDANYEFIYYLMHTKKNDLLNNASGSTFLEISPNKVKSLEVSIPSLAEQTRIANILSDMDAELAAVGEELEKARQMKQGMMQELLTGRVRFEL